MYEIRTDIKKNRLYLDLRDIESLEIPEVPEEISAACRQLADGFTCISLFPKFDVSVYKDEDRILRAQETILLHGPGLVVRVVEAGQDPLAQHHMETLSLKHGYSVQYVSSLEEGERLLDRFERTGRANGNFRSEKTEQG